MKHDFVVVLVVDLVVNVGDGGGGSGSGVGMAENYVQTLSSYRIYVYSLHKITLLIFVCAHC